MSEGFRNLVNAALSEEPPAVGGGSMAGWLAPTTESRTEQLAVESIRDPEWRQPVDTTDPTYRALKASVRASGILQPLLVRPVEGGFEAVSGLRRLRAARDTGVGSVPAVIRELGDLEAMVGAWDALRREQLTEGAREDIRQRLLHAGMAGPEAAELVGTLHVVAAAAVEVSDAPAPPLVDTAAAPAPEAVAVPVEAPEAAHADAAVTDAISGAFGEDPEAHGGRAAAAVAEPETDVAVAEPEAEVAVAEPEAEVAAAEPEGEVAVAEPEGEVAVAEPEAEVAVAEPDGDVAVAEPEGEVAVAEPEGEVAVAEPEGEVAVAEPEGEVAVAESEGDVAVAEPDGEVAAAEPEAEVAELDVPPVEPDGAVAEPDTVVPEADAMAEPDVPSAEAEPIVAGEAELPSVDLPGYRLPEPSDIDLGAEASAPAAVGEPPPAEASADASPPVAAADAPPAEASPAEPPAAEGEAIRAEREQAAPAPSRDIPAEEPATSPQPRVITIEIPSGAPTARPERTAAVVVAPPPGAVPEVPELPADPVPAVRDVPAPAGNVVGRAVRNPRTYATLGTFMAVWAIVFLLVEVLLGSTDTRLLLVGAIVAGVGLVTAIASLAVPSRTP